ncbi:DUF4376 domain-containing protein [Sporomusa paucivorans]|uniref:DUF4376 domain-containing protein n=1 Tax=Sporomusa paucivorans TaxID=2376 RepID=UPI0035709741
MVKYLAHYNADTGTIQGFYSSGLHRDIPSPTLEITAEQHADYFARGQNHRVIDGVWTYVEPEGPTLDERKNNLRAAINVERDRREQGGFVYAGKQFDSDATSVIRINAAVNTAVSAILAETEFAVNWTAADNTTVPLDAQGLLGLSAALAQHSNTQHVRARDLKEQLEEAETAEELVEVETLLEEWKAEA